MYNEKKGVIAMSKKKFRGFTIIELIVVIAIIAVLAAIIVPSILGYMHQANASTITANARNVYNAAKLSVFENHERCTINGNEIYTGDDSGTAHAAGGSDDLSVGKFMGEDFKGHYAFVVSSDGNDVLYAVWSNKNNIDISDVKMYTYDEIERDITGKGIGSYPTK